jgi:DtxR family Mn-dependent transcriptional regulator
VSVSSASPTVENYLECIFELEEAGIPALRARLVERLKVSAPSVSETVGRLEREGYLILEDRVLRLTPEGRRQATAVMRRHRLAERLLVDVLKVPWHQVHEEAHALEHAISDNLERHLIALLGDPATCPHGNPIPGSANPAVRDDRLVPVSELGDRPGVVRRIDEGLEAHPEQLLAIERAEMTPGAAISLVRTTDGQSTVRTSAGESRLPDWVAEHVYAEPEPQRQPGS